MRQRTGRFCAGGVLSEITARDQLEFMRFARQIFAEIGVGDGNQQLRPFGNSAAFKVHHAVFGHHIHHIASRRGDDVSLGQRRDDAAFALAFFLKG